MQHQCLWSRQQCRILRESLGSFDIRASREFFPNEVRSPEFTSDPSEGPYPASLITVVGIIVNFEFRSSRKKLKVPMPHASVSASQLAVLQLSLTHHPSADMLLFGQKLLSISTIRNRMWGFRSAAFYPIRRQNQFPSNS
jgi:hypothetical protein